MNITSNQKEIFAFSPSVGQTRRSCSPVSRSAVVVAVVDVVVFVVVVAAGVAVEASLQRHSVVLRGRRPAPVQRPHREGLPKRPHRKASPEGLTGGLTEGLTGKASPR